MTPKTTTILVVDDQVELRESVARILERSGYRVFQAGTAEDAVRIAEEEALDLLLADVILPGTGGLTVTEQIHRIRPAIRVLYTSGYTGEEVMEDSLVSPGAMDFLQKPFTGEELTAKIRELLETPVSDSPSSPSPDEEGASGPRDEGR